MDNRLTHVRQRFIDYFRKNGHKYLRPSKVHNDDPTLMFVNAGMNQLKQIFLGKEEIPQNTRVMNSQICVRAGGKHNDLDDVGFDSYHLTSFEMLGNWSLNDYFKEEAIYLCWNCLMSFGLDSKRIYVTYFEGTDEIPEDTETKNLWKKYVPEERIVPGSFNDNFWMMGDYGPCGVSTEVHYDLVGNRTVPELVNQDNPDVIEIWNNVFVEYNKDESGYHQLDQHFVDTGMGLERLGLVLQNKKTIYQTDGFRFLIGYAQALSSGAFFTDTYNKLDDNYLTDVAYRIFADHIRTTVVALFDGVEFGHTDRGHVLKTIFRRLLTYYWLYLNSFVIQPVMGHSLVKCLIEDILNYHQKKNYNIDTIQELLIEEEGHYIDRLRNIPSKFKKYMKKCNNDRSEVIKKLYNTEGIPMEILEHADKIVISK